MDIAMERRRFLIGTGVGVLSPLFDHRKPDSGEGSEDGRASIDVRQDEDFGTFVERLATALAEVDAAVVSSASCLGYGVLLLTTGAEQPNDPAFNDELSIVADEYLAHVGEVGDPPSVGLLVEVYRAAEAAEDRQDPFATYDVETDAALDALETGDDRKYWHGILQSVTPPVWAAGDGEGEAAVGLVEHERITLEEADETGVEARIENAGNGRSGSVELEVSWYDGDGDFLDDNSADLRALRSGETWIARVYPRFVDAEDVEDYEAVLVYDHPNFGTPDGLTIDESELHVNGDARIHGALSNETGEELSYVAAIGRVFDAEGRVLGDDWTNGSYIEDGATWRFDLSYDDVDRSRLDAIERYEVIPVGRH